jgi:hypothetical protein
VLSTRDEQAAARAWSAVDAGRPIPGAIERLTTLQGRPAWKSECYRLSELGDNGGAVIAKRASRASMLVERAVYEDILPCLPLRTLRFYGFVEEPERNSCWLFLEDARGAEYDDSLMSHRILASDWLAVVHSATSTRDLGEALPDRGPHYYLDKLRSARERLLQALRDPRCHEGAGLLASLCRHCDALESAGNGHDGGM